MRWSSLTTREKEVVALIGDGHNNESISHRLDISINTVKRHLTAVFRKLRVTSRLELCITYLRWKQQGTEFDNQSN